MTASVDSCAEIENVTNFGSGVILFSGVTSSGRVLRKVPESNARSVARALRQNGHAHVAFSKDVLLHNPLLCRTELLLVTLAWG